MRLYSVEESDLTEKQKTTKTVCATSRFSTGGGPDIESEGANPTREEGSPDRADGAMRMLQDEDSEDADDADDADDTDDGEKSFASNSGDTGKNDDGEDCEHGTLEVEKAPDGFD